jgi:hypothetical protein
LEEGFFLLYEYEYYDRMGDFPLTGGLLAR